MGCSEAQLAANRANAARSTGPKTEAGKARSRRNSLKHGLTGGCVVLPHEDEVAIAARFAEFDADLKPIGAVARFLVRRAALLSIRLDRAALHETATLTASILAARAEADPTEGNEDVAGDESAAARDDFVTAIVANPAATRREHLGRRDGVEQIIGALLNLHEQLRAGTDDRWTAEQGILLEALLGNDPKAAPSTSKRLSAGVLGDGAGLNFVAVAHLDADAKRLWARRELVELIAREVEHLRDHAATLEPASAQPLDTELAEHRALFDATPEGTLARKYEAATERSFLRIVREVHRRNAEQTPAERGPKAASPVHPGNLGSFFRTKAPTPPPTPPAPAPPRPDHFGPVPSDFRVPDPTERITIGQPPTR